MRFLRKRQTDEIKEYAGGWSGALYAYPATVALLFGAQDDPRRSYLPDSRPDDRACW
jgi:hypothetical protein